MDPLCLDRLQTVHLAVSSSAPQRKEFLEDPIIVNESWAHYDYERHLAVWYPWKETRQLKAKWALTL